MIVDCFCLFNELDVLEIRLAELYPVVDKFVLVESTKTHKGDDKPLYYAENRQRFARYNDKIWHVTYADVPGGDTQAAIWRREIGQRQAIARALTDLPGDTIVLVSDLDEIPRREYIAGLRYHGMSDAAIYTFQQTLYYFNFNTAERRPEFRWNGTRATHLSNVRALTPDGIRWEGIRPRSREYPQHANVPDAGWHLSYFGDVQHIQRKMRSFLHQELVTEETLDPDVIARRMAAGLDIWGREQAQQFTLGAATDLPWLVRSAPHKWLQYFHPDWRPTFHEDWYDADQAAQVAQLAQQAPEEGAVVEIGSWEGRSAVAIAQSIAPRELYCVDHWRGNEDEGDKKSTQAAQERDVYGTFKRNMDLLAPGNISVLQADWRVWIDELRAAPTPPIAFAHIDASHDYESVKDCLVALLPFLVDRAILCGDDFYGDGVHRAVRDVLGDSVQSNDGRLWVWQNNKER